jgi:hypothetical protein
MCGWIKLHRSIKDHWLYTEDRVFSKFEAWNDILLTVNFADAKQVIKGKIYNIKRGESTMSLETWAKRWNWDKSKVRRFLTLLQSDGMIVVNSDNITTHLSVCNYASYQDERNANETQVKRKRNADEIQTTPIKEEEKQQEQQEGKFVKPTIQEIEIYMQEKGMENLAERFYYFYEAKGWVIGKNKIKDWKSCVMTWKKNSANNTTTPQVVNRKVFNLREYDERT